MRRGWAEKSIDELAFVGRGKSRHRPRNDPSLYGGEHPFVQTAEIHNADLWITTFKQTYSEKGLAQSKIWDPGTICITNAGENTGDCAILGIRACFPDSIIAVIADESKSDTVFLKYAIDQLKPRLRRITRGATQDNLSVAKLTAFKFPAPPLEEQQRIGAVLRVYGDLIENNRRRIQLLEQSARLLYKEWFVHLRFPGHEHVTITDGVPEGWEKTTAGSVSSFISRGITPKYDDEAPGIVLNQKCIRNQRVEMGLARRQSKQVSPDKFVRYGDVLINSTGQGTLGRVAQFLGSIENCTVDSHVTITRPDKDLSVHLYGRCIASMEDFLATMGRGATNQTELSKDTVAELPFLRPPHLLAEQFEAFAKETAGQIQNLIQQNTSLAQARDLLLPRLMSGG